MANDSPADSDPARSNPRFARGPFRPLDLLVVGGPLAVLYALTCAHDLGTIDSGELATVCTRLGIAHPTGYPLYTLLGRLAVLFGPGSPITAVNVLSAVAAWVAALSTVLVARSLLDRLGVVGRPPSWVRALAPWAAGLWFGTDRVLWLQATSNEVYSLHLVAVVGVLGCVLALGTRGASGRTVLGLGYLLGLAFSHHLSSAFLVPAVVTALWFWQRDVGHQSRIVRWLIAFAGMGILAWSVNLYLPIRSAQQPVLDWGDTETWTRFWRHYLAAQYRVWQFESADDFARNLGQYVRDLPVRVSWVVLALSIPGLWRLRSRPRLLVLLGLVLVTTLIWASGYSIHDLGPYYLPADLVLVLFAAVGLVAIDERMRQRGIASSLRRGLPLVFLAVLVFSVVRGWPEADRSKDHFIRTHATMVLESLPPDAVLLSGFWDAVVSASLYLQEIEGLRPDVTVVDPELLRRSWYFPQLRRRDPGLLAPVEPQIEGLLRELALFESGRPYDPAAIEQSYRTVIAQTALAQRHRRPPAFTPDVNAAFATPLGVVPEGLVFAVREDPRDSPRMAPPDLDRLLRAGFRAQDPIHVLALAQWRTMADARVRFLDHFGRSPEAGPWRELLETIDARAPGAFTAGPRR